MNSSPIKLIATEEPIWHWDIKSQKSLIRLNTLRLNISREDDIFSLLLGTNHNQHD